MTATATGRLALFGLLFAGFLAFGAKDALGQNEPLGDEFFFFAEGSNVLIPDFGGQVVNDPTNPANKVAQFNYSNWSAPGWRWQVGGRPGVDATANVSETVGGGDTLYFKIWVDPANLGQPGVTLTFFDSIDETAPDIADKDIEFRIQWELPAWIRNGEWHTVAVPLPPSTTAALDSAKAGKNVDGTPLAVAADTLLKYWDYPGGWVASASTFVDRNHPQYKDFSWADLRGLAVFFDNNTTGGTIFLDDVYIGGPNTDISTATSAPDAMGAINAAADGPENVISWTHNPDFGGYRVYVSDQPITSVSKTAAGEVVLLGAVPFNAEAFEFRHRPEIPHPSLGGGALYYAVTSTSAFGVENQDVTASTAELANPDLVVAPFITMLTAAEGDALFNNILSETVEPGPLAAWRPFVLDANHSSAADGPVPEGGDPDLSGKFWMGIYYAPPDINELYVYAEVTDDVVALPPPTVDSGDPASCGGKVCGSTDWNFDSIELNWGSYEVPWLVGSTHTSMQDAAQARGAEPDHQLRINLSGDGAGGILNDASLLAPGPEGLLWEFPSHQPSGSPISLGSVIGDFLTDGQNVIGYKVLSVIPFEGIIDPAPDPPLPVDEVFVPPAADQLKIVPFNIALNDQDASGSRESQIVWSIKPNVGGGAWANPLMWTVTAVAGRDLAVAIEEEGGEVPGEFALDQNYPNPFNPSTTIRFSLATAEDVTLKVYDLLGREVATLIDGKAMNAGTYTAGFDASKLASGMYLYRLKAGSAYIETKSMVLLK